MMGSLVQRSKIRGRNLPALMNPFLERSMFPYSPQQASSVAAANLQSFVNVTKRFASGLQQLAELNVQTVKTVFEESTSVLKAGSSAKPGDFLSWQSTLLAEIPEKTAAYTRHYFEIVRATEADILNETRGQYEKYGIGVKGVFESMSQGPVALLSNIGSTSTDVVDESAEVVLDASAEVTDGVQEASDAALRPAKAGSKR
ncbi:TIGR01841 family phasin [Caballeronia telluris]|jgi:phasin family protein|nr:TIGR01841 family phasin [Caballeronia telluris]